jgi:hypothetical protein
MAMLTEFPSHLWSVSVINFSTLVLFVKEVNPATHGSFSTYRKLGYAARPIVSFVNKE